MIQLSITAADGNELHALLASLVRPSDSVAVVAPAPAPLAVAISAAPAVSPEPSTPAPAAETKPRRRRADAPPAETTKTEDAGAPVDPSSPAASDAAPPSAPSTTDTASGGAPAAPASSGEPAAMTTADMQNAIRKALAPVLEGPKAIEARQLIGRHGGAVSKIPEDELPLVLEEARKLAGEAP